MAGMNSVTKVQAAAYAEANPGPEQNKSTSMYGGVSD